jgi:hypothetical protein
MSPYERVRLLQISNNFFDSIAKEHRAEAEAMYQAFKARMILELVVLNAPLLYAAPNGFMRDRVGELCDDEKGGV